MAKWGSEGSGDGQFILPMYVAVDSSGNLYVADTYNHRIQKFDSDGSFLAKWGSEGSGDGQFNNPFGVAVDSQGNVYVADTGNGRIQKFDSDGVFLTKWGSYGSGEGQFDSPLGVAVDSSGNVYVADAGNNRIQKFTYSENVRILQPNGGEMWDIGSWQNITWTSSGIDGNVNILLSRDGGINWQTITSDTQNDGIETLIITGPKTTEARIKISSVSGPSIYDISDNNFTIITQPVQIGPTVRNFIQKSGYSGDEVTIVGTNFIEDDTRIMFGTILVDQDDLDWQSTTLIKARVPNAPESSTTGRITVTTSDGTTLSAENFTVKPPKKPWNTQIGIYNNVPAYSNGGWYSLHYDEKGLETTSPYGYTYQCVEYVNRYYTLALGHKNMIGTGNADTYFWNAGDPSKGLVAYSNGGETAPCVDDILVFDQDEIRGKPKPGGKPGHVAIVKELIHDPKSGQLTALIVIQQNWIWEQGGDYKGTMQLKVDEKKKDGKTTYTVFRENKPDAKLRVMGWSRIP